MIVQKSIWSVAGAYRAMKQRFAIGRVRSGAMRFRIGRRTVEAGPGTLLLGHPGDVHQKLGGDGVVEVLSFSADAITDRIVGFPRFVERRMVPAIETLYTALDAKADTLELDEAVEEAFAVLGGLAPDTADYSRPVRLTLDMLRADLGSAVSLDALAAHAGLEKFRLCRAFRTQVGMPPHAYRTHLRVHEAKRMLERGVRASEVAMRVGFYDQSQLNKHMRRIMGVTPGEIVRQR